MGIIYIIDLNLKLCPVLRLRFDWKWQFSHYNLYMHEKRSVIVLSITALAIQWVLTLVVKFGCIRLGSRSSIYVYRVQWEKHVHSSMKSKRSCTKHKNKVSFFSTANMGCKGQLYTVPQSDISLYSDG